MLRILILPVNFPHVAGKSIPNIKIVDRYGRIRSLVEDNDVASHIGLHVCCIRTVLRSGGCPLHARTSQCRKGWTAVCLAIERRTRVSDESIVRLLFLTADVIEEALANDFVAGAGRAECTGGDRQDEEQQ